jgi:hypothetical protein
MKILRWLLFNVTRLRQNQASLAKAGKTQAPATAAAY